MEKKERRDGEKRRGRNGRREGEMECTTYMITCHVHVHV